MRTQADVAAAIRSDRETWRTLVADVGPDRLDEPGPMGEWTFGDMAGHLAGWRNYRAGQFEAAARGEPDPGPPWPAALEEDDDINAWIHEHDRDRSAEDLVAEYDASFERLAAAIEALPEAAVADPNAFPWMGGDPIVDADFTSHLHDEHLPAVRAWLDRT
jgi:hypothetical protein